MSNALNLLLLLGPWTVTALVLAGGIFIVVVGAQVPQMLVHASVACYAALMLNTDLVPIPGVVDLRVLAVGLAAYLVVVAADGFGHL